MSGSISILGIGSGLQLQDILDQLKDAESTPILRQEAEQLTVKDRVAEFDTIKAMMLELKDHALTMSLESTYLARSTSLSDSAPVSVSTAAGAESGSYHLDVVRVAQKSAFRSEEGFASAGSIVNGTGSAEVFSYGVGGSDFSVLSVPSGTTLNGLAALINDDPDNPGVTATVVQDGSGSTPYKLLLQSDTIGEAGRITVTQQLTDLTMAEETGEGGASLDAELKVDGVSYVRGSNTISDAISDVTINLQSVGDTTLTLSEDSSSIKSHITNFVDKLNELLAEVNANNDYDLETGVKGSLYGVTSINQFGSQLLSDVLGSSTSEGGITSLTDLGIEYNRDGTLSVDEDAFDAAFSENYEGIKAFLLGDSDTGVTGWADTVNDRLRQATASGNGIIESEKSTAQAKIDRLEETITLAEERLDRRFEIMAKQFQQLDSFMSEMSNLSTYLANQFDAFTSASSSS